MEISVKSYFWARAWSSFRRRTCQRVKDWLKKQNSIGLWGNSFKCGRFPCNVKKRINQELRRNTWLTPPNSFRKHWTAYIGIWMRNDISIKSYKNFNYKEMQNCWACAFQFSVREKHRIEKILECSIKLSIRFFRDRGSWNVSSTFPQGAQRPFFKRP